MDVAVVDYTSPTAPEEFATSLRETGFGVIINHPLDWSLVEQVYREWSTLFDDPAVRDYTTTDSLTGYFPPDVSETAKGFEVRDLKEFFHVYPWSIYPSQVSDVAMRYRDQAMEVALTLLDWVEDHVPPEIAERLSMPLSQMMDNSTRTLLRVLRYPPLPPEVPEGAVRAAAHEDINLLTVLPASDQPGLELLGSNGQWYPVPLDPGSLAINGGEMLDLATAGYYPATKHRVVNPVGEAATVSRMSLPLFLHPADDVVLAEGRTAYEFLMQRIAELRGER
jgi:isopenicillin N synthase-like dioxygenase